MGCPGMIPGRFAADLPTVIIAPFMLAVYIMLLTAAISCSYCGG